jgi:hypothetical protein
MRIRNVVRLIVVAAVSLFILYAPSREQEAYACPAAYQVDVEFWRMPVCAGNPPICEQVEPELLGTLHIACDYSESCTGVCDGVNANRIIYKYTRRCPLCEDQQP